jgi:hypothetical protein
MDTIPLQQEAVVVDVRTAGLLKKYGEVAEIPRDSPWVDPPAWWDKGLTAWGELLTEQWEIAKNKPPTRGELERGRMLRKTGRAAAEQMQRIAIEVLTGENHGQDDR